MPSQLVMQFDGRGIDEDVVPIKKGNENNVGAYRLDDKMKNKTEEKVGTF